MAEVTLDGRAITDWESFHDVSAQTFGFPEFYGRNLNAWIDCMTYLDDGMSRFNLPAQEDLLIRVAHSDMFRDAAGDQFRGFLDAVIAVNRGSVEAGGQPRLVLVLA
jgi:hypothetical protein